MTGVLLDAVAVVLMRWLVGVVTHGESSLEVALDADGCARAARLLARFGLWKADPAFADAGVLRGAHAAGARPTEGAGGAARGGPTARAALLVLCRPWAVLCSVASAGEVGLGESYMRGEWRASPGLAPVLWLLTEHMRTAKFRTLQRVAKLARALRPSHWTAAAQLEHLSKEAAQRAISVHYDRSDVLYAGFLDESMTYTSALYDKDRVLFGLLAAGSGGDGEEALAAAQQRKRRAMLDKTLPNLATLSRAPAERGATVLDIGCGWGGLALEAVARGDVRSVVGVSNSRNHVALCRARAARAGVLADADAWLAAARAGRPPPAGAAFVCMDYRELAQWPAGCFDAVVSCEMVEAIGADQLDTFAAVIRHALRAGGRACIQFISAPAALNPTTRQRRKLVDGTFTTKYIFPGGQLPHVEWLQLAFHAAGMREEQHEAFGRDYARTLRAWRAKLAGNWAALRDGSFAAALRDSAHPAAASVPRPGEGTAAAATAAATSAAVTFSEEELRKYEYYLCACEAGFAAAVLDVHQVTWAAACRGEDSVWL